MSESNNRKQLEDELNQYCSSDSPPSEEGVREIIARHRLTPNNHNRLSNYNFFYDACHHDEGIIRCLLDYFPDAAKDADELGSPLHFACENDNVTLSIIQLLIDAAPDSVRSVTDRGSTPLHILCGSSFFGSSRGGVDEGTDIQILKLLLEKYPEAARHVDEKGRLPIHYASGWSSPKFCSELIEAYPGSERIRDGNGKLPIHMASSQHSLATVEYLYRLYPGSEQMPNANGALPFHAACTGNSLAAVKYLYGIYPEAINHAITSGYYQGCYPIHKAIESIMYRNNPAAAVEIVQFLLNCDPNQKLIQLQGKSLLRYACGKWYNNSNIEAGIGVIKVLFDAHPEAIKGNRNASSIRRSHKRIATFLNGELVYARQAKDHRLMTTPDDNGQLPLHKALQNNVRLGSIKLLVKGNPSALRTLENSFALPLHIACQHHDSASVVQYLLSIDEAALEIVDKQWNTVLHYACCGAKHDTIALLLEKYDAASVSKRNAHGKLPIDMLWESSAVEDRESVEYMGSIFQLMRAYPEMVAISSSLGVKQPVGADATRYGKKRKKCHDHEE